MRQNLHLVIAGDIGFIRIAVAPDMVGVGHIFYLQGRLIGHFFCKGKKLILVCIQDSRQLDVFAQHIRRRTVYRKLCDRKTEHFRKDIHFLFDLMANLLHIGQAV